MRLIKSCILLIIISFISCASFAKSTVVSMNQFNKLDSLIAKDQNPTHTLLVMDDDDTLTMMPCDARKCQYLGGPAWFQWQSELPANSPARAAKTFTGLLADNTFLMDMSHMPLVEQSIPQVLQNAKSKGIRLLVATARGSDMLGATERQFQEDQILSLIASDTITTPSGQPTFPGAYLPKHGTRSIAYQNGILYLAGQNKGVMLKDFLQKTHMSQQITHIIFIDDTYQNVKQVAEAYANNPLVDVTSIYYTHLQSHKGRFLTGTEALKLQHLAALRWKRIQQSLEHNLPGYNLQS